LQATISSELANCLLCFYSRL